MSKPWATDKKHVDRVSWMVNDREQFSNIRKGVMKVTIEDVYEVIRKMAIGRQRRPMKRILIQNI